MTNKMSNTNPVFLFAALLLGGLTVLLVHPTDWMTMVFNLAFLGIMYWRCCAAYRTSLRKIGNTAMDLDKLIRDIRWLRKEKLGDIERGDSDYKDRVGWFWDDLKKLEVTFSDPVMEEHWKQYLKAGIGSEAILEADTAVLARYRIDYANQAASSLTGMGLLGTVLGLVFGLHGFQTDTMEASIVGLINGLSVAFFTTIYGVVLSLLLNQIKSNLQQQLSCRIYTLQDMMHELYAGAAGDTAMDSLVKVERHIDRNVELLRRSITEDIGRQIGRQIGTAVTPIFKEIRESLDSVITELQGMQYTAISRLADDFAGKVMGALDRHIDTLGEGVRDLNSTQTELVEKLGVIVTGMNGSIDNVSHVNQDTGELLDRFERYLQSIQSVVMANDKVIAEVGHYSESIAAAAREQSGNAAIFAANSGMIEDANRRMKTVSEQMAEAYTVYRNSFTALNSSFEKVIELQTAQQSQPAAKAYSELSKGHQQSHEEEIVGSAQMERLISALERNNQLLAQEQGRHESWFGKLGRVLKNLLV